MALGALTLPAIVPPATSLSPVKGPPAPRGGPGMVKMSPMESMMVIFEDIRTGIDKIPKALFDVKEQISDSMKKNTSLLATVIRELIKGFSGDDRDKTISDAGKEEEEPPPPPEKDDGTGGFRIPKPGPKMKLALLLGGLAALMKFGDKLVPLLATVLKFIKEKALPFAIDAIKLALEGIKSAFDYLYENIWPFFRDNLIPKAVDYVVESFQATQKVFRDLGARVADIFNPDATWWERITSFLGIFTDVGQFFIEQFDRLTEFVANVFGVSFAPYDGLISYITGKLTEGFKVVVDWFSQTGTFLLEGATGIIDWIKGKLKLPFEFLTNLFSFTEEDATAGGIATKLIDIILLPYNLAINFLRGIFGFGADEEGNVEPFSLGTFVVDAVKSVIDFIKDLFSFDLPSMDSVLKGTGDIIQNLLRAVLPSPDFLTFETPSIELFGKKYGGGTISLNPIPDSLYQTAGIDSETGGDLVAKSDGDTLLVTGSSVQTENSVQTETPTNGAELSEGSKEVAGGTVITNINTTDASQTNQSTSNTTQTPGLAVEGSDSTAKYLAAAGI